MRVLCVGLNRRSALLLLAVAACPALPAWAQVQKFADVVAVKVAERQAGVFDFDVTVSSPYDTPERYADGFRVMSEDGRTVFGVRTLWHDHAGEQPFTRDLYGVKVPGEVGKLVVQARDKQFGWGGGTQTVTLPGR
ncbi:hypothetical protein LPB72_12120 [Hydrogenophaga crassostreae]|uniref:Uncharacterized protein n=1 Tax=Hydrogenophaga crassostreae TaxID=1763535 RepID=A0A162P747_9BURK|nr:hypothetical protein [Hydrogenophaga crassostreae]AOW13708.1 hypothetical protein LPB072_13500 [Hydrogenophaga crassostreae]OAD42004.1 hypothetical protein LPB72_12120 [Hydrogenophaga crassostreae]